MLEYFAGELAGLLCMILQVTGGGSFPPPLSPEREALLLARMNNGDRNARNELIERNLRLVAHIIKKYYSAYDDQDDLISIGTIGLIKGVNSFNAEKGTRLATYAARCIENEILMYFRVQKKTVNDVSMTEPIDIDPQGNPLTLIDIISVDDTIIDDIDLADRVSRLHQSIRELDDPREKAIIISRYGLDGNEPLTQREIAAKLGISRSYVSRLETKVLRQLRKKFDDRA